MKKIIYIIFFFIGVLGYSQEEGNRFLESENTDAVVKEDALSDHVEEVPAVTAKEGPGNTGDPAPVDDYVPLLFLVAVGLIAYTAYKKKASL